MAIGVARPVGERGAAVSVEVDGDTWRRGAGCPSTGAEHLHRGEPAVQQEQGRARAGISSRSGRARRLQIHRPRDHDLVEFGLARVVATFRPLLTFKTATARPVRSDAKRRAKPHREDRR